MYLLYLIKRKSYSNLYFRLKTTIVHSHGLVAANIVSSTPYIVLSFEVNTFLYCSIRRKPIATLMQL